ncbi:MAG: ATP synthase gamma chain [Parcubacteria group bacterium GW2011_GWC2_44_17]|uniref:ATP synthase gamma chain n=1 Tax=Candidatus Jacksonbacteria bacterium RIFCSPLOWO2_02_FULL_44_20 TaxID=1798460 RepID=A0A1G2A967_9BACT|nr:MAG: ATP synthase gamma chain [Parcubacteria group bacterium GW2011_GWC2_44_17]KKT49697.1 MAG: ATP synthase gamma chain [Parcubacteria group bacterium GW2011_GWF2_44_17]OGY71732.1 MAG: ATP synthase F1 subunit gamma [Candidatus Jacksonbacteria bacterium RIFCSPHIGHO2_02_FULL_44_25]OGY72617.1 MAG: ATP synthase F1 subunit gamma [Candidatus Jacksonbacteria bacterium RIFCSPLOWO2_02_FULL_44_20]OGY73888.1 MAG: ATP synthase F1 subunit gamma [Candidatus Jacksonbacteria bacterium RIFCSPLOWO2_12_FULL_44
MPSNTRDIKRRIKSVGNIKQITRAMQLVATSKMRRAQKRSVDADAYAYGALEILEHLTKNAEGIREHPFWREQASEKVAIIIITSNRGFCGGFNVTLLGSVLQFIRETRGSGQEIFAVTIGKKGRVFMQRIGIPIIADFMLGDYFTIADMGPIAKIATEDFVRGEYKSVFMAFNQFINTLVQKPVIRKVLPLDVSVFKAIAEIDQKAESFFFKEESRGSKYIFEPAPSEVFATLVPHLLEVEIYKALLESGASEHSARMVAMKNSTDKAGELIDELRLVYNQARQAGITKEIAEISSGAMATK